MGFKTKVDELMEHILIHYRWVFVFFLLPLSFIYNLIDLTRTFVVFKLNSAPKQHSKKVQDVQKQILEWRNSGSKSKLCTARPGWQTMSFRQPIYKDTFKKIKINLVDILEVDKGNMTVRCEPLVNMGQLSKCLESEGLALAVVPEIDDLTVGGVVMGTGIETSSHIHGLFQHICQSYELVLADGSVVNCSKDENQDLFYSVPWSYGTLGFLTSVVLTLVPARKYVRLEYHPAYSQAEYAQRLSEESLQRQPHQFVECLLYERDEGILMLGDMVDEVQDDGQINAIGDWRKPWFFKHVEGILDKYRGQKIGIDPVQVEYIPLRDYYHRHTRSLFWELQDIIPFGNHPLFRHVFGWLMPPKVSLMKLTQTAAVKKLYERSHVIQDMLVPIGSLQSAIQVFHDEVQVYPIWLCPFKLFNNPGLLKVKDPKSAWEMFVDIGVYGVPKSKRFETVQTTRLIEDFVAKNSGFQMLYADTYTTREEFRTMFHHQLYDVVRRKLPGCVNAFPEIYDKVSKKARR